MQHRIARLIALALLASIALCLFPSGAAAAQFVVAVGDVTLYTQPDGNSAVAGTAPAGTRLTLLSTVGSWYQLSGHTVAGWCLSDQVTVVSGGTIRRTSVNDGSDESVTPAATTPNISVPVPAPSPSPANVTVSVTAPGTAVSTPAPTVTPQPVPTYAPTAPAASPSPAQPAATFSPGKSYGFTLASTLNVRQSPSMDAAVLRKVSKGTRLRLMRYLDGWYQVQLGGASGWVKAEYIALDANAAAAEAPYTPVTGEPDHLVWINLNTQVGAVLTKDNKGYYTVVARTFGVSTGLNGNTPTGLFNVYEMYRWKYMHERCYTQYAMRIYKGIMLHSEPYYAQNPATITAVGYNKLGAPASDGCIRMRVEDVKWIYDNCGMGTLVHITKGGTLKGVPTAITYEQIPANVGWDPTDPDENNPYFGQYNKTYTLW